MTTRHVLRNATIADGSGGPVRVGDVAIRDDRIEVVGGRAASTPGDSELDCTGRVVMPGFIDAHAHADGLLFDEDVQLALLRQGLTTVIGGQDGVSYAPGDGRYASEYFAALNGAHPAYRGTTVADLLATYDHATRLNVAYVVPGGTVRYEVMGRATGRADGDELRAMRELVAAGIGDGAVGLSTGLDYVPGIFADTAEIAALCQPVAEAGAVYVTHMRGGYEANSAAGLDEVAEICRLTGVKAHISHFHTGADSLIDLVASMRDRGVDLTFDAYPYIRGCTLLGMPLLPPELAARPVDEVVHVLTDPDERGRLRTRWFPELDHKASLGPDWPGMITLSHIAAPEYAWAHGLTLREASERAGRDVIDFSLDLLAASGLRANAVMAVRYDRPDSELARILSHDAHVGGSDGIFVGDHPHPRAYGTFARYLAVFLRELGAYTWASAAVHLSARPADRFGLGQRGRLKPGYLADVVVIDPERVRDAATYQSPVALATGIDDVFVAGRRVLAGGALTAELPGVGIRRSQKG